jgi:hypothetical protein
MKWPVNFAMFGKVGSYFQAIKKALEQNTQVLVFIGSGERI